MTTHNMTAHNTHNITTWDAPEMLTTYRQQGLCFVQRIHSDQQLQQMHQELDRLVAEQVPGTVFERDGKTIRAMHGCHLYSRLFDSVVRDPALLSMAQSILGSEVYVHQFKINFKKAFTGAKWDWHQDFVFWQREDGLAEPHLVNMIIALDEINEFNGPLLLLPKTHHLGCLNRDNGLVEHSSKGQEHWQESFAETLKYTVEHAKVKSLADQNSMVMSKCKVGQIMLFDSNIIHASSANISPYQRKMLIISYNRIDNGPTFKPPKRPAYISGQDCRPLSPLSSPLTKEETRNV